MPFLVINTIPSEKADSFAEKAVRDKKAACATIINGEKSIYWWKGKIESEKESVILFKASDEKVAGLEEFIKKNHPYEVPEIISIHIDRINAEYKKWLVEN